MFLSTLCIPRIKTMLAQVSILRETFNHFLLLACPERNPAWVRPVIALGSQLLKDGRSPGDLVIGLWGDLLSRS